MVSENCDLDWATAIICDSDELPLNLEAITMAIAKECKFNYLPSLTLFEEARALFFCKNMAHSLIASIIASLRMSISTIFLNKYSRMVNVIDSIIADSPLSDSGFQLGDYLSIPGTPKPLNL